MNIKPHILTALIITSVTAWAQQPPPDGPPPDGSPMGKPMMGGPGGPPGMGHQHPGGRPGGDMMGENFFPPDMVMRNQKAISLTADQQKSIKAEMQKSMSQFTDLQWQQSAEEETMAGLMKQDHPDEKQVLAQLDKLLDIENEIKRLHLTSMIRIKNILTPEQQKKLHATWTSAWATTGRRAELDGATTTTPGFPVDFATRRALR